MPSEETLRALLLDPDLAFAPAVDGAEDGAVLLDDVATFIGRYVATSPAALVGASLWAAHTHAFDAADCSPRFAVLSAEPQSGKTRFLEVLRLVVREPLFAVNVSEAALFRVVESRCPTILHDEIDAVFGPKARDREDLRAMLNAGYERGAAVERCVGEGTKLMVKAFPVFAPVALAGIGRLPETIEQRSIVVHQKRRAPGEQIEKLRRRQVGPEAARLRARLESWAAANLAVLAEAEPEMPDELDDRTADIWEPLLAIADATGGHWPERARQAAVTLFGARRVDETTIGARLLRDIRAVFDDPAVPKVVDPGKGEGLGSGDLAANLGAMEGAPWAEWSGEHRDKPITPHGVAKLLRRYDIDPAQHWLAGMNLRGYLRADFDDAWSRYVPAESVGDPEALGPLPSNGKAPNTLTPLTLSARRDPDDPDVWFAEQTAALDPDDPWHGLKLNQLRAEHVRRKREVGR